MASGEVVKGFPRGPALHARSWDSCPRKWIAANSLIHTIDSHGVVCCGAPKRVSVGRICRDVNAATRIDQPPLPIQGKSQTQGIRMTVAAAADSLRTGIDDDGLRIGL